MSAILHAELQAVLDAHGRLTPALLVQVATPEDSPLHLHFEWDDDVAGHKFRLHQARQLIRSVRVVYREASTEEPARRYRAFSSVEMAGARSYVSTEAALVDPFQRRLLLNQAKRELAALHQKYNHLEEWIDLLQAVQQQAEAV